MQINKSLISVVGILTIVTSLLATRPDIIDRGITWTFGETNTTQGSNPSNLKYLKFYDILPDEVSIKILNKRDLSQFVGKKIYVGYGTVDPQGKNCRVFPSSATGMDHNVTICLPWWRIERTYQKSLLNIKDMSDILCVIPTPHPPLKYDVCKEWVNDGSLSTTGGKVTCTSYYNRLESTDCWNNPKQAKCLVNNCSIYTQEHCDEVEKVAGIKEDITTAEAINNTYSPVATKINVITHQYQCPAGSMVPFTNCKKEQTALMYPYECSTDNPDTPQDDSKYVYCDENNATYDASGKIVGFVGTCPAGTDQAGTIMCDVDRFSQTSRICEEPINLDINTTSYSNNVETKTFKEYTVDVLSGEPDIYASKPNCIRANTIDSARQSNVTAHIVGDGNLDDDIWIAKHRGNGTHFMVYCNEQHNENAGSKKMYDGVMEQCISNNGNYSFEKTISIDTSDIVSIQEATEGEDGGAVPFWRRADYGSTKVTIDGIVASPETWPANFPYYPTLNAWLNLWENSLGTLSILFPYSGAYRLSFYNKDENLVVAHNINMDDFDNIVNSDYIQLKLAKDIAPAPGIDYDSNTSCIDDDWTEIGGGIHGNKNAKGKTNCKSPNDAYVKEHAIYKVMVKDLLTGNITPIPLVYPLAYPNRIFISKLKLYELRKYRCYTNFNEEIQP